MLSPLLLSAIVTGLTGRSRLVEATPSVYACPFNIYGPRPGFDFSSGQVCGADSFLYYYACCEDNIFQCCFYFETWAMFASVHCPLRQHNIGRVVFSLIGVAIIASLLFCFGRYMLAQNALPPSR